MSYEGYTEWMCENGHIEAVDVYCPQPSRCRHCGLRWGKRRSIDQTNGHDVLEWLDIEYRAQFNDYTVRGYGRTASPSPLLEGD